MRLILCAILQHVDPLSDVVALLRVRGALTARLEAAGDAWALRFRGGHGRLKFGILHAGSCWVLDLDGDRAHRLEAGDCYLLTSADAYTLAARPGVQPEDGDARFRRAARDGVLRIASEPSVVLDGGTLSLDERDAGLLLRVLPPFLRVRDDPDCAATIALLARETIGRDRPGAALARDHLAQVLFVQMLRAHVDDRPQSPGWLGALADPQIGTALGLIHAEPARNWRVPELAEAVSLSRSAFAARFKALVGLAPAEYALQWRMHRAAVALRVPGVSVTQVAREHGYGSHSSFSKAYKAVMGVPPTRDRAAGEHRGRISSARSPESARPR
jgi:AraC-like DNA-binding protein